MIETNQDRITLLRDINAIREMSGAVPYQYLPDKDDPIRYSLENLFNADAWNITPYRMEWLQLDIVDHEDDAMPQYHTLILQSIATPDSFLRFYFE